MVQEITNSTDILLQRNKIIDDDDTEDKEGGSDS